MKRKRETGGFWSKLTSFFSSGSEEASNENGFEKESTQYQRDESSASQDQAEQPKRRRVTGTPEHDNHTAPSRPPQTPMDHIREAARQGLSREEFDTYTRILQNALREDENSRPSRSNFPQRPTPIHPKASSSPANIVRAFTGNTLAPAAPIGSYTPQAQPLQRGFRSPLFDAPAREIGAQQQSAKRPSSGLKRVPHRGSQERSRTTPVRRTRHIDSMQGIDSLSPSAATSITAKKILDTLNEFSSPLVDEVRRSAVPRKSTGVKDKLQGRLARRLEGEEVEEMEDTETLPPTRSLSRQFPAQTTDKKRKRGSREDDGQQDEERELSRTSKGEISSLRPQSPAKEFTSAVSKKVAVFKGLEQKTPDRPPSGISDKGRSKAKGQANTKRQQVPSFLQSRAEEDEDEVEEVPRHSLSTDGPSKSKKLRVQEPEPEEDRDEDNLVEADHDSKAAPTAKKAAEESLATPWASSGFNGLGGVKSDWEKSRPASKDALPAITTNGTKQAASAIFTSIPAMPFSGFSTNQTFSADLGSPISSHTEKSKAAERQPKDDSSAGLEGPQADKSSNPLLSFIKTPAATGGVPLPFSAKALTFPFAADKKADDGDSDGDDDNDSDDQSPSAATVLDTPEKKGSKKDDEQSPLAAQPLTSFSFKAPTKTSPFESVNLATKVIAQPSLEKLDAEGGAKGDTKLGAADIFSGAAKTGFSIPSALGLPGGTATSFTPLFPVSSDVASSPTTKKESAAGALAVPAVKQDDDKKAEATTSAAPSASPVGSTSKSGLSSSATTKIEDSASASGISGAGFLFPIGGKSTEASTPSLSASTESKPVLSVSTDFLKTSGFQPLAPAGDSSKTTLPSLTGFGQPSFLAKASESSPKEETKSNGGLSAVAAKEDSKSTVTDDKPPELTKKVEVSIPSWSTPGVNIGGWNTDVKFNFGEKSSDAPKAEEPKGTQAKASQSSSAATTPAITLPSGMSEKSPAKQSTAVSSGFAYAFGATSAAPSVTAEGLDSAMDSVDSMADNQSISGASPFSFAGQTPSGGSFLFNGSSGLSADSTAAPFASPAGGFTPTQITPPTSASAPSGGMFVFSGDVGGSSSGGGGGGGGPTSIFGAPSAPSASSSSGFFGMPAVSSTPSPFGIPSASNPSPFAAQTSAFASATTPASVFGAPSMGSSSSDMFAFSGASAPTPATPFGAPTSSVFGGVGGNSTSGFPPFGGGQSSAMAPSVVFGDSQPSPSPFSAFSSPATQPSASPFGGGGFGAHQAPAGSGGFAVGVTDAKASGGPRRLVRGARRVGRGK